MAEDSRLTEPWMVFVVAVLLVAGGGMFLAKPFESSRHKETVGDALSAGTVPARLWQDPFTAVVRCREDKAAKEDCKPKENGLRLPKKLVIMPVMVYGDAYSESVETRRRRRYAVLSAMFMQGYRSASADTISYFERKPPGTYIVPYEWLQPNRTHYGANGDNAADDRPSVLLLWLDERRFKGKPLTKLKRLLEQVVTNPDAPRPGSSDVGSPHVEVQVTLLGPAGSTVLRDMVREASDPQFEPKGYFPEKWKFSIFSPVATASAKLIVHGKDSDIIRLLGYKKEECPDIENCKQIEDSNIYGDKKLTSLYVIEQIFGRIGIEFFRTISSDKAVLREIIEKEFERRGINNDENDDGIVLVSEWDTFYGRSLPEAFINSLTKKDENGEQSKKNTGNEEESKRKEQNGERRKKSPKDICPRGVCRYVYMRGLDGEIPESEPSDNGPSDRKNAPEVERAVGANRFDYLRRLAQRIKNDFSGGSDTIRAVGVLGSDVYDKLVVLQALRPSFPDALFFITDADARYLHPTEFRWTRGLVVLSGYDLIPGEEELPEPLASYLSGELELELPPFRDSYQTSVFFATRLAMSYSLQAPEISKHEAQWRDKRDALRKSLAQTVKPKTFEVGRSMFVPLGEDEQRKLRRQIWPGRPSGKWSAAAAAVGLVLLCIFLSVQFNRRLKWRVVLMVPFVILTPLLLTTAVHYADGFDGEPLPISSGANMMPTLAGLFVTLFLTSLFFVKSQAGIGQRGQSMIREFELMDDKAWARFLLPTGYFKGREVPSLPWLPFSLVSTWRAVCDRYWMYGLTVLHVIFSVALVKALGDFAPPIRGQYTRLVYHLTALMTLSGFLALAYLFVDEVRKCRTLARRLISGPARWSDQTLQKFAQQRDIRLYPSGCVRDGLARWIGVRLLAEKSLASENVIYYPFMILLFIIVVHSGLFDDWRFVPSVIIVLGTGILVIATCILFLRFSVKQVRESALSAMRMALAQDLREGAESQIQSLKLMIEDVQNERLGAFRPLFSDPIFKALLMPLGGYGSLYLIDYLTRFAQS